MDKSFRRIVHGGPITPNPTINDPRVDIYALFDEAGNLMTFDNDADAMAAINAAYPTFRTDPIDSPEFVLRNDGGKVYFGIQTPSPLNTAGDSFPTFKDHAY